MNERESCLKPDVLARIGQLELRAKIVVEGFISGLHRSPYHGYSVEFASHREYAPGDDIRHIDWRVFARADRLYIKQYEEETNLRAIVALDCSRSMAYPDPPAPGRMTKFDYARTVAASLIYLLMHQQDACGLVLFDHAIRDQLPVTSSQGQIAGMIDVLERNEPDETTDVKMLLRHLAEQMRYRGLVILISDMFADADELIEGLQHLRYTNHDVIVLQVMHRDELEFPFEDNVLFEGLEAPEVELLTDPQSLRESYLRVVGQFIRRLRSACMNHRIDYQLLSTADPIGPALATLLAARMRQTAR